MLREISRSNIFEGDQDKHFLNSKKAVKVSEI